MGVLCFYILNLTTLARLKQVMLPTWQKVKKKKKSQLERKKAVVQPREGRRQNGGKSPPREKMEFIDYAV